MANISQAATNERSLRSVFVGNIPYDASEEKLKDIFSEAGPVLSFKLVYDRESGKPKGYGFCEYRDQETALSAMRNLNSYELNGRVLRVDTATNERFKEEIKNLQMSAPPPDPAMEIPYGPDVDADKAPEQIAKVVSSLPPEQMYEIAKQMKHCVLTNPNEARNMLVQNPQLAYALLQLLVVMRSLDINTASSILYKPNPPPIPIQPSNVSQVPGGMAPQPQPHLGPPQQFMPGGPQPAAPPQILQGPPMHQNPYDVPHVDYNRGPPQPVPAPPHPPNQFDQRQLDPRLRQNDSRSQQEMFDPRIAAQQPPPTAAPLDPRLRGQMSNAAQPIRVPPANQPTIVPPVTTAPGMGGLRIPPGQQPPPAPGVFNQPPNQFVPGPPGPVPAPVPPVVPVSTPASTSVVPAVVPPGLVVTGAQAPPPSASTIPQSSALPPPPQTTLTTQGMNQSEAEKAHLIMQVLSLSDEQINMLQVDQRQSILLLRQQLQQQQQQQK